MARVPIASGNLVQLRPVTDAKIQTQNYGAEQAGRGLEVIGQAGQEFAAQQEAINRRFDEAAAKQADNALSGFAEQALYTGDNAYFGKRNQSALDAREGTEKALNDQISSVRSTLKTPRQQWLFDQVAQQRRSEWANAIGRHAIKETQSWENEQSSARSYMAVRDATRAAVEGDDKGFAIARDTMLSEIRSSAQRNGLSGAPAQMAEAKALNDLRAGVVEELAVKDPRDAQAYLTAHADEISDPNTITRLTKMLDQPLKEQQADTDAQVVRGAVMVAPTAEAPAGQRWNSAQLAGVVQTIPGARITSTNRTAAHNAEVNGVAGSQHIGATAKDSTAIDFVAPGMSKSDVAAAYAKAGARVTVLQHDAGSGMHFHVQGVRSGRAGKANAPRENDLDQQLASVDRLAATQDWSYDRTEAAKSRLIHLDSIDRRLKSDQEKVAADQAWTFALDPKATSLSAIPPALWGRVAPETQRSIMAQIKSNASPDPRRSNPDLYYKLATVAGAAPDEFAKMDLRPYASQMSEGEFHHFADLQVGALKSGAKDPKMIAQSTIWASSRPAFEAAGFKTGAKASKEDKAIQAQFLSRMNTEVAAFTDANKRQPTPEDIDGIRDRLLLNVDVLTPGRLWGTRTNERAVFQTAPTDRARVDVPGAIQQRIIASYQRTHNGQTPDATTIGQTYIRHKGDLW